MGGAPAEAEDELPDDVLDQLRALPGVEDVTGTLDVGATAEDGSTVALLGIDDRHAAITGYDLVGGRLPGPGADEVVLAAGNGPDIGSTLTTATASGQHRLTVVGLLDDDGFGEVRDGTIKLTSLGTARRLTGQPSGYGSARAVLADLDEEAWLDEHDLAIQGARIQDAQQGLNTAVWSTTLTFLAAVSLFISAFLIYLTLSSAILERTSVYGTLRAPVARSTAPAFRCRSACSSSSSPASSSSPRSSLGRRPASRGR